jgi:predicted Zn-dependent peptidase
VGPDPAVTAAPVAPATAAATKAFAGLRLPQHRITTLDNGVRVITERMQNVRSVALGFWIGTGSAMESHKQAGLSHLLEHMLFRGTDTYRSEEIDQIFDAMGAEINAGTDRESTSLFTRVLDGHLERALHVMGEMVWHPRFEDLAAEREVVLEEIAMYEDDPQDRVFDVLGEAVFGDHPLGRAVIGRAEVVRAAELDGLHAFHDERYLPQSIVVAAAGSVDHDELVRMVGEASTADGASSTDASAQRDGATPVNEASPTGGSLLESAAGQGPPAIGPATEAPSFERRVRFLRKDTEQYHVCLGGQGISRHDERRFALRVLEGVLGGTSSSRLFQEVREKRGLAYSVFSFSNLYAHTGEVGLYVGTRPDNLGEAIATIAGELERFVESPVSDAELTRSRENVKGRIVLALESTAARMNRLGSSVLSDLPILSVDEIIERIDAIEAAALHELAAELFAGERLSVAGVGTDENGFAEALEPLGALAS